MSVPTKVDEIRRRLGNALHRLRSAFYVLRVMCEPGWLDLAQHEANGKFQRHLREMFAHINPGSLPQIIQRVLAGDGRTSGSTGWVGELISILLQGNYEEWVCRCIGDRWWIIRTEFENYTVRNLALPFLDRMIHPEDELRKVWALWFEPTSAQACDELDDWIRERIDDELGFPGTSWDSVKACLKNPLLKPRWPDVDRVINRVDEVCHTFHLEGREDLVPTESELQEVAVQIVSRRQPREVHTDSLLIQRAEAGDLKLASILESNNLQAAVAAAFAPVSVSDDDVLPNLQQLVECGILTRNPIGGRIYYFTSAPRKTARDRAADVPSAQANVDRPPHPDQSSLPEPIADNPETGNAKHRRRIHDPGLDADAVATLVAHPGWSVTEIAESVGCTRQHLYRLPIFSRFRELMKQGKDNCPSGIKHTDSHGNQHFEAFSRQPSMRSCPHCENEHDFACPVCDDDDGACPWCHIETKHSSH